jgi:branched-chain amino acid transport system ATP-binding protein
MTATRDDAAPGAGPTGGLTDGLSWAGVHKRFGGLKALTDVSVTMPVGSVTAVIGPNGAGKTTLFNAATGLTTADSGQVTFGGQTITRSSTTKIARLGLRRTFQNLRMVEGATVWETVLAASAGTRSIPHSRFSPAAIRDAQRRERERLCEILSEVGLLGDANRRCTSLSLLHQRKVEIARALAGEPSFVLLDEPTAGATPAEAESLGETIRRLPALGISVGLIEHSVGFIAAVADRAYVLNFGEVVAEGSADTIADDPRVRDVFVGAGFTNKQDTP